MKVHMEFDTDDKFQVRHAYQMIVGLLNNLSTEADQQKEELESLTKGEV